MFPAAARSTFFSNYYKSIYIKAQRFVPQSTISKVNSNYDKSIYIKAQRFVPLTTLSKDNSNHYKSVYIKAQRFVPRTALSKVNSNHYKSIYIKAQRFVPLTTLSKVNSNYYKNIYIKNHKKYHEEIMNKSRTIQKTSWKNHQTILEKSWKNHEQIINESIEFLQISLNNEEKTCFPLQPEAHFPKDDISDSKDKTKAQLLTRRIPTQLWQDTVPPNSDDTRSHPLRREDWKSQGTDKEKAECPRTKKCFPLQPEAHFWKTRT